MPSRAKSVSKASGEGTTRVLVVEDDPGRATEMIGSISALGYHPTQAQPSQWAGDGSSLSAHASLVVASARLYSSTAWQESLGVAAAEGGVPVLVIVDDPEDAATLVDRLGDGDDWIRRPALDAELSVRLALLLKRRAVVGTTGAPGKSGATLPADSQFFALVVHDLRTPLNVIGLSLRMIAQSVPQGDPDLDEDIRFVDENYRQIERMLAQLSDFYRLFEHASQLTATPFSPRRMIDELLEGRAIKGGPRTSPVALDLHPNCPEEVALDPLRARQAIQYVLANATASSNGEPIRLSMHGGPERWIIEVAIDRPPPSSVQSVALSSQTFERLCGFAAERRGMDLAIAAKVSEMFGGTARLDAIENQGTVVVLDWPARLKPS